MSVASLAAAGGLYVKGRAGPDQLSGDRFSDTLLGAGGDDTLQGLGGSDFLYGQGGDDLIEGGKLRDQLTGGLGQDRLFGGADSDTLFDGEGADAGADSDHDELFGGAGDDVVYLGVGDLADGGSGQDFFVLSLADLGHGIDADFRKKTVAIDDTLLKNFEGGELTATAFSDTITIGSNAYPIASTLVLAGGGDDTIRLFGRGGLYGESGDDRLTGGEDLTTLNGGSGDDTLVSGGNSTILEGGAGKDLIDIQHEGVVAFGGGGRDIFQIGANAVVDGGKGADHFNLLESAFHSGVILDLRDFAHGDVIDLSEIDADPEAAGDQAFRIVEAFTGHFGEMMIVRGSASGVTTLRFDADGDGVFDEDTDPFILVAGATVGEGDLVL